MKKLMTFAVILAVSSGAMAQLLPVLETAGTTETDQAAVTLGGIWYTGDSEIRVYGVRGSYCPVEDFLVIGDFGMCRTGFSGEENNALGLGIAGQYSFSQIDLPVDLALRLGYAAYDVGLMHNSGVINGMVLISGESEDIEGLAAYGGLGAAFWLEDNQDASAIVDLGLRYIIPWADSLSVFGELMYVSGDIDMDGGLALGVSAAF